MAVRTYERSSSWTQHKTLSSDLDADSPLPVPAPRVTRPKAAQPAPDLEEEEDYDFVEPLLDEHNCSVCLDVLKEPHLTTCCGRHFCRACLQRVVEDGKPCPLCKEDGFLAVIDKSIERRILSLKVRCPHKELGCQWVGEMRDRRGHLDFEKGRCEYRRVRCPNGCGELVPRMEFEKHLTEYCSKRKLICQYCNQYTTYGDVEEHNRSCEEYPVGCPNGCSDSLIPRRSLTMHLVQCPYQPIPCEFERTGCMVQVRRSEMAWHMENASQAHLVQMSRFCLGLMEGLQERDRVSAELQRKLQEKDQEIDRLHGALRALQADVQSQFQDQHDQFHSRLQGMVARLDALDLHVQSQADLHENVQRVSHRVQILETLVNVPPYYFTMTNFSLHKRGTTQWTCPAFYSELGGYKMALEISAYGEGAGKGTHVSVYIRILRGEYDDILPWPLRASVMIQLISQVNDAHYEMVTPVYEWTQVNEGVVGVGWGWDRFIGHSDLQYNMQRRTEYLRNDRLNFRVIYVDKQ